MFYGLINGGFKGVMYLIHDMLRWEGERGSGGEGSYMTCGAGSFMRKNPVKSLLPAESETEVV